jgi:hypothetical protein
LFIQIPTGVVHNGDDNIGSGQNIEDVLEDVEDEKNL